VLHSFLNFSTSWMCSCYTAATFL